MKYGCILNINHFICGEYEVGFETFQLNVVGKQVEYML